MKLKNFVPFTHLRSHVGSESHKMTSYTVQFSLPVDNPVNKVSVTRKKSHLTFDVPLNHPEAHKMNLMDLIAAAELSGLLGLSTHLNKNSIDSKKTS